MRIPAGEPGFGELGEVLERVAAFGRRVAGQEDLAQLERHGAALGDLDRARKGVGMAREVRRHLGRGLEEELVRVELPVVGVLQRVTRLDAEQRLVRERVLVAEVVDVPRRDERQARGGGELRELGVDPLLLREACVLDLDVRRVAAEDLREPVEVGGSVLSATLLERLADTAREAARQRHDALRVPLEQLPVDTRLVVVALEVAERGELDEVAVALVRLGEQRQVRVALRLLVTVVSDVHLAPEDRLDALLVALAVELDGAGERAVIGERDGGHLQLGRAGGQRGDAAGAVEDRVLRVDVEVDERRVACSGGGHGPTDHRNGSG